jgi:lipopolysaccharide transport system ATP-binding protein
MTPMVTIEHVSKRYRLGGLHPGYFTLRELLERAARAPFRRRRPAQNGDDLRRTLWALQDLNLEVRQGELLGIVGHNGAGKSTLLKILSRITRPTTGRITLNGRVGSLLEVGTGFHPELTGRENIYLNGAILGMRRAEIARKFDEIVAFSEVERFIETPVKRYSSGMYVRLAFSVAAHLEPEILIMDEVLAVGDAAFQQKCLDKLHEIRQQGRTIFFVSHNMPAVTRLCKRVLLMQQGRIVADGDAREVVNTYLSSSWNVGAERVWPDGDAPGNDVVCLRRVRVRDEAGATVAAVDIRRPVGLEVTYEVLQPGHTLTPVVEVYNEEGAHLFSAHDTGAEWRRNMRPAGTYTSTAWLPGNFLAEGSLIVHASVMSHYPSTALHVEARKAVAFQVLDSQQGDTARGDYLGPMPGVVRPLLSWTTSQDAPTDAERGRR